MALINWNDSLSVNVAELDEQHKQLIRLINEFCDAVTQKRSKEAQVILLGGLAAYTKTHFATEERYFARFGYPGAAAHRKEHDELVQQVADIRRRVEEGRLVVSIEILNFLTRWLNEHILGSDKQYSAFFNAKGLV